MQDFKKGKASYYRAKWDELMEHHNCSTLEDLIKINKNELFKCPGVGRATLSALEYKVGKQFPSERKSATTINYTKKQMYNLMKRTEIALHLSGKDLKELRRTLGGTIRTISILLEQQKKVFKRVDSVINDKLTDLNNRNGEFNGQF